MEQTAGGAAASAAAAALAAAVLPAPLAGLHHHHLGGLPGGGGGPPPLPPVSLPAPEPLHPTTPVQGGQMTQEATNLHLLLQVCFFPGPFQFQVYRGGIPRVTVALWCW